MQSLLLFKNKGFNSTFNLISKTALFGTLFFKICWHFVTLLRDKKVLNILFDVEKDVYSVSGTSSSEEKKTSTPSRSWTYDLLFTTPEVLPLSNRRLISGGSTHSDKGGERRGGGGGFGVLKKCLLTLWASVWSKNNNSVPPLDLPLLIIAKTTNYFWLFLFAIAWFCISSHISTSHCHDSVAAQDWTKHPSNICYKLSWYAGWQACYSTLSNVFLL